MNYRLFASLTLGVLLLVPHLLSAGQQVAQQADDLESRYKLAMSKGDVELAVGFLCDAAKLEPKKYDKKCVAAQHHENEQLQAFDGFYAAGQTAMQQKDYAGAIREFSKITFGIRREDAAHYLQEAKNAQAHPQLLAASKETLIAAQAAYERGDLATAETNARQIQVPELQAATQQILTNIHIYQDAMKAGDAARQGGNYLAAQQKYKFAIVIRPNGPGNPAGKLQEVEVLLAASTVTKPTTPLPNNKPLVADAGVKKVVEPPKPNDSDAKIKAALAEGHAAESRKDIDAALQAFERVLAINPHQPEALASKQHIMENMQKTPQGLENTLTLGLHDYYRSQLAEAGDAISLYLTAGGVRNRGVAYFYLGATFASQALLADPKAKTEHKSLEQHALLEFQQARCEHYQPIEKYLSPKVLALWSKSTC